MLPFTREQFLDVFARYNDAARRFGAAFVLPGVLLAWAAWQGRLQFGRQDGLPRALGCCRCRRTGRCLPAVCWR